MLKVEVRAAKGETPGFSTVRFVDENGSNLIVVDRCLQDGNEIGGERFGGEKY